MWWRHLVRYSSYTADTIFLDGQTDDRNENNMSPNLKEGRQLIRKKCTNNNQHELLWWSANYRWREVPKPHENEMNRQEMALETWTHDKAAADSLLRIRLPCWVFDRYVATKRSKGNFTIVALRQNNGKIGICGILSIVTSFRDLQNLMPLIETDPFSALRKSTGIGPWNSGALHCRTLKTLFCLYFHDFITNLLAIFSLFSNRNSIQFSV